MPRLAAAWLTFWAAFGVVAFLADRRGWALCRATRWLFRTHTRSGRVAFTAAYGTGALVLHRHVLKDP